MIFKKRILLLCSFLLLFSISLPISVGFDYLSIQENHTISGKSKLAKIINVEPGDSLRLSASGTITYSAMGDAVGPEGDSSKPSSDDWVCREAKPLSLYGKLGAISSDCFEVGKSFTYTVVTPSSLLLGINDVEGAFDDNSGKLLIEVQVNRPNPATYKYETNYQLSVDGQDSWKDTKISISKGDMIVISAEGLVGCSPDCKKSTPDGMEIKPSSGKWPCTSAKGLSLIGKVGQGECFQAGSEKTFESNDDGMLFLGVNDDFLDTNVGSWEATILVFRKIEPKILLENASTNNATVASNFENSSFKDGNKSKVINTSELNEEIISEEVNISISSVPESEEVLANHTQITSSEQDDIVTQEVKEKEPVNYWLIFGSIYVIAMILAAIIIPILISSRKRKKNAPKNGTEPPDACGK